MFILLSKTLNLLLSPLTWVLLFVLAGIVLRRRRPSFAAAVQVAALLVLALFSMAPVANTLARFAESSAAQTYRRDKVYDAVILLGGGFDPEASEQLGQLELNGAGDRIWRSYRLVLEGKARHLVISGGTLDPRPGAITEAAILSKELREMGVDSERIVPEPRSRNTRENALESKAILEKRGWTKLLVVTSAMHMPRALGCFRAVGLEPDALPVDLRSSRTSGSWIPRAGSLQLSVEVLRELAGRWIYRALGYSVG